MKGWYKESYRHYLASKGVKTARYVKQPMNYLQLKYFRYKDAEDLIKDIYTDIIEGTFSGDSDDLKALYAEADYLLENKLAEHGQLGFKDFRENRENIYYLIKNIRGITEKLNSGEGTIGKLLADEEMHTKTDELIKDVKETLEDAREQAPITSFIRAALTIF